jgi:uncharacterized protein YkwD
LQIKLGSVRVVSGAVKTLLGVGLVLFLSTATRAQTYYYYPASAPAAPAATPTTTVAPSGYWGRDQANQVVWYSYAPQYYQVANTTQAPQTYYSTQYYPTTYQAETAQPTYATQPAQPTTYQAPAADTGDAYGFLGWLNATRASYGLSAVGYDANLTNWAAMNNNQQAARGMGHFVMGPARRQNAAMGAFANIGSMWMNSPAHRAALLDPTITAIGIAGLGAYWTFNAY